jgi:thymidylate synthase
MAVIDKTYHRLLEKIMTDGYTYEDPNRKGVNRLEIPSYTFRHEFKDGFPAISTKKLHYKNVVTELIWFLRGDTNIKYLVDNGCNIWNKDAYNYYLKQFLYDDAKTMAMSMERFIELVKSDFKGEKSRVECENYKLGDLGPVYGHQWRKFTGVKHIGDDSIAIYHDQIEKLITNLKEKPLATDNIVNSWNVGDLQDMALPPCHYGFQVVVRPLTKLERINSQNWSFLKEPSHEELNNSGYIKYGFELHWNQRSVDTFLG